MQTEKEEKNILKPVTPHDCALALTIPLTKKEFLDNLAEAEKKDYAAHIKRVNFKDTRTDEDYWYQIYRPLTRTVLRICGEVEKLGVTVKRSASLADFGELLAKFKVVTLVAHWRFNPFTSNEITDFHGFLEKMRNPVNAVQSQVRDALEPFIKDHTGQNMDSDLGRARARKELVRELNSIITNAHALYSPKKEIVATGSEAKDELLESRSLYRLTRVAIEQGFPDEIAPGRALEFSDGLCTVADVIETIPVDFNGLIDITACNSVIIGEIIKFRRPDVLVAINRYQTRPHIRFMLYRLIIGQLARRPTSFLDAIIKVHKRRL